MTPRRRSHQTFGVVSAVLLLFTCALAWLVLSGEPAGRLLGPFHGPPRATTPAVEAVTADADGLMLPKKLGSLRFAVMGDVGRGDAAQYATAAQMAQWHDRFDFSLVLMLGDNMYGPGTPEDYAARFERPYRPLLDAGVQFYAANGNHDPLSILNYPLYNMNGHRYYTFTRREGPLGPLGPRTIGFFAIDTVRLDQEQQAWIRREMGRSDADWKICFFHHPLYTSGRYRASALQLRRELEPLLVEYGADVGLAGHEHVYERMFPQRGILYFTSGSGGALRVGDIRPSFLTAAAFDTDNSFILMEISGDDLYFQTISRTGDTVDSGHMQRIEPGRRRALSIGK